MTRQETRRRTTRAHLVETARELFGSRGYEGTSTTDVLRESGLSRGALYHHFASKEALFLAVFLDVEADIAADITAAAMQHRDQAARLRAGCMAWLELGQQSSIRQIALVDAPSVLGWRRTRQIDVEQVVGGLAHALRASTSPAGVPDDLVEPLAHMLRAAMDEAVLYSSDIAGEDRLRRATAAVDLLLALLAASGPRT